MARITYAPFDLEELTAGLVQAAGLDADTVTAWMQALYSPDSVAARAGELGGAFDPAGDVVNDYAFLAAEFPSANMVTDARSLARMYAATVSEVDGNRLLDPATVERMTAVQTDKTRMHVLPAGLDLPANRSFNMSLGFWRIADRGWVGPWSFGHPGSGGSVGFGDLDTRVGFGYIPNLWSYRVGVRAKNLAGAVKACLG